MNKPTIIYIISDQRSGSTLLENILSKSPDILSVGELRLLSDYINKGRYGKSRGWKCSCGEDFKDCKFWSEVIRESKKKGISDIKNTKIEVKDSLLQYIRGYPHFWSEEVNKERLTLLREIYSALFKVSDKDILIDSSKDPFQGLWIYRKLEFQVKIISLKRDCRAVALSKQKWQLKLWQNKTNLFKLLGATKFKDMKCKWVLNRINPKDKISITYSELSKNPKQAIDTICRKFEISRFEVPQYMYLDNDHTIAGTPNRFKKRAIKYDDAWRKKMAGKPIFRLAGKLLDLI